MAGFLIGIGGRYVTYFAADDVLDPEDSEAIGFDFSEDAGFRSHPRLRRVLTTMVRPVPRFYGVLHWSDGSDLNLLDEKVQSGQADDADFAGALLAEPRTIVCRSCLAQVRVLPSRQSRCTSATGSSTRANPRTTPMKGSCAAHMTLRSRSTSLRILTNVPAAKMT